MFNYTHSWRQTQKLYGVRLACQTKPIYRITGETAGNVFNYINFKYILNFISF